MWGDISTGHPHVEALWGARLVGPFGRGLEIEAVGTLLCYGGVVRRGVVLSDVFWRFLLC